MTATAEISHFTLGQGAPLAFKFAGADGAGEIEGLAATFGGLPDSQGDVIDPGAFAGALASARNGVMPLMLWQHDRERPIGRWTALEQRSEGLLVSGQLNLSTSGGSDAYAHLKASDISGLSIGYRVSPGGAKRRADGVRVLTSVDLVEISVVSMPAMPGARVTSVKSFGSKAELEAILRTVLPGRAVKKLVSGGWPALSLEDDEQPEDFSALLAAVKAARRNLTTK